MRERRGLVLAALLAACAGPGYAPCPLDLGAPLPDDAFDRCRAVLHTRYGALAVADREAFLLQTEWQSIDDPPGERRASVFRDDARDDSLLVVVELRRLTIPLLGVPHWTEGNGDTAAERELVGLLRASLSAAGGDPEGTSRTP